MLPASPNGAPIAEPRSGYNTPIPESILTPDRVSTRIGELEFFDGLPTPDTAKRVFDHLDFIRGVEDCLNGVPAASLEGMRRGLAEAGRGGVEPVPAV